MSLSNDNSKRTLNEIKSNKKIPLTLSSELISRIGFMHYMVGRKEWSGVLIFREVEGSIEDLNNLKLYAEDIYPMDIGSAAYTEYEVAGESITDIYDQFNILDEENDEQVKKLGHIHTHHSMEAYFSGTDMGELHTNADQHSYYLSLIVNFNMEFVAKVGIYSPKASSTLEINGSKGKTTITLPPQEENLILHDCEIEYEQPEWFVDQFTKIQAKQRSSYAFERKRTTIFPGYQSQIKQPELFTDEDIWKGDPWKGDPFKDSSIVVLDKDDFDFDPDTAKREDLERIISILAAQDTETKNSMWVNLLNLKRDVERIGGETNKYVAGLIEDVEQEVVDAVLEIFPSVDDDGAVVIAKRCINILSTVSVDMKIPADIITQGLRAFITYQEHVSY